MSSTYTLRQIAHIENDLDEKFGIPRQSGLVNELKARIVFEPDFRNPDALRGLEDFSHIWLIWQFSKAVRSDWSPTVRPPRLGGNKRVGVFSTRSPFRPNALGLSSVVLESIEHDTPDGTVLHISGADLMNGTPIYDIKPYIPKYDSHPNAHESFTSINADYQLLVTADDSVLADFPMEKREALIKLLAQDPRPQYHEDESRQYVMSFAGFDVKFVVKGNELTVISVERR